LFLFFFFFWEQEKDKSGIGKSCKIIKGVWEWNGSFGACKEDCNCGEREREESSINWVEKLVT
jgi:hypothetical protein